MKLALEATGIAILMAIAALGAGWWAWTTGEIAVSFIATTLGIAQ